MVKEIKFTTSKVGEAIEVCDKPIGVIMGCARGKRLWVPSKDLTRNSLLGETTSSTEGPEVN